MPRLTDRTIRALRAKEKPYKRNDELGLLLVVSPTGRKYWHFRYPRATGQNQLSLGRYPEVSLSEARAERDHMRRQLRDGKDPSLARKEAKLTSGRQRADTFGSIAAAYIEKEEKSGKAAATIKKARYFAANLSTIEKLPICEINPPTLIAALRPLESAAKFEALAKTRSFAARVWDFAIASGLADRNPAQNIRGAFATGTVVHRAAPLDIDLLREVLTKISKYENPTIRVALQLIAQTYVRPGVLRQAEWSEIDLGSRRWRVPAEKMKGRQPFELPLSVRSVELFREIGSITGNGKYVFPSATNNKRPMSENALNSAMRRMDITKEQATAHGFRAVASTHLNEHSHFSPDAIEISLAHKVGSSVRRAYHRGDHWEERVELADWWSRYLADVEAGAHQSRP
ncbi:tyrosine-type recombinase/integrase [Sphingomicrobium marinum]|uniref:tyrosine-type recombinase/integrase n=1 Tax=Sphingomicrobium marinum TaxID=1227950 RepID=UPI00223ED0C0|nr:integrase arm-type DNA-binding domain-containing protein [Sphingomicrobium marinum]